MTEVKTCSTCGDRDCWYHWASRHKESYVNENFGEPKNVDGCWIPKGGRAVRVYSIDKKKFNRMLTNIQKELNELRELIRERG